MVDWNVMPDLCVYSANQILASPLTQIAYGNMTLYSGPVASIDTRAFCEKNGDAWSTNFAQVLSCLTNSMSAYFDLCQEALPNVMAASICFANPVYTMCSIGMGPRVESVWATHCPAGTLSSSTNKDWLIRSQTRF